ncbi:MAG: hypothetical protein ABIH10_01500 [Spirochaetota bacterium]
MKRNFTCRFETRCRAKSPGCTPATANASECGFIATVEKEKSLVSKEILKILKKEGSFINSDPSFLCVKESAKNLTTFEFDRAVDAAITKYYSMRVNKTERFGCRSPYFVR